MLTVIQRIKQELQLSSFHEKNTRYQTQPMQNNTSKICSFCRKSGQTIHECHTKLRTKPIAKTTEIFYSTEP